ncbi:MAG: tRNA (adenosine(37)-N6)-threonylcarbamoyltransferase complex ATPase subunit type 1 TsaE [bacterium]
MTLALDIITHTTDETALLAQRLAALLRPHDVLVLQGELGSGKTEFVRGLAVALGHSEGEVCSPTFTIVNEYLGERPLFHFDLYRISDPEELYEIGWDDYLARDGLVVVEWGEKAGPMLPSQFYLLQFEIIDETSRHITVSVRRQ